MKWNYLDETRKATTEAIGMWREKNKKRPPDDKLLLMRGCIWIG